MTKQCTSDTNCDKILEAYSKECENVINWDGNSTRPNCTDECKQWIQIRERNPITKHLKCCVCDEDDEMDCAMKKRNIEALCGVMLDSSDECQNKNKSCKDIRAKEDYAGIMCRIAVVHYNYYYYIAYQMISVRLECAMTGIKDAEGIKCAQDFTTMSNPIVMMFWSGRMTKLSQHAHQHVRWPLTS